jgi:hypothetical protein
MTKRPAKTRVLPKSNFAVDPRALLIVETAAFRFAVGRYLAVVVLAIAGGSSLAASPMITNLLKWLGTISI